MGTRTAGSQLGGVLLEGEEVELPGEPLGRSGGVEQLRVDRHRQVDGQHPAAGERRRRWWR